MLQMKQPRGPNPEGSIPKAAPRTGRGGGWAGRRHRQALKQPNSLQAGDKLIFPSMERMSYIVHLMVPPAIGSRWVKSLCSG